MTRADRRRDADPTIHARAWDAAPALEGASITDLAVWPPTTEPGTDAETLRRSLHGTRHATVSHVAVLDGDHFVGLVDLADLLAADATAPVERLMLTTPPVVAAGDSRDVAAAVAIDYGAGEVVVLDGTRLVGIVPSARLLATLSREHADDLARLSGYLHQGDSARTATSELIPRRLVHRLPWLLFGLAGAFMASLLVSSYERQLDTVVALAFFVPALVYLAGAVGAQTVTIAVRGLSVGVQMRGIAVREVITGVFLGAVLGAAFMVPATLLAHDTRVGFAVGLAFFAACAFSNVIALLTPWAFARLRMDPAYGAGPIATMGQDLLSVWLYFTIATLVLDI